MRRSRLTAAAVACLLAVITTGCRGQSADVDGAADAGSEGAPKPKRDVGGATGEHTKGAKTVAKDGSEDVGHGGHDHGDEEGDEGEHGDKGKHGEKGEHGEDGEHAAGGHVRLTKEQIERLGIPIVTAGPGTIDMGVQMLPGEVQANGDRIAHIVPRFPGIAREVRKRVGDVVKTGDVLAVIESSESLAPYELRTLLDGTVIEKHITRGEAVDREKQTFVIADLGTVWIDLSLYQKDLPSVRVGSTVRITDGQVPAGAPADNAEAQGTVTYVTPTVDETTRTATARVVLSNPDGRWRPGMFVTARVIDPVPVDLSVPRSAVQKVEGRDAVFVETDEGFAPRPIAIGRAGEVQLEVLMGLEAGERYAASNTFWLKAELGKGEAEHEH